MPSRVYVVERKKTGEQRLVRASFKSVAQRHVSDDEYASRVASQLDMERLITAGVKVELADPLPPIDFESCLTPTED